MQIVIEFVVFSGLLQQSSRSERFQLLSSYQFRRPIFKPTTSCKRQTICSGINPSTNHFIVTCTFTILQIELNSCSLIITNQSFYCFLKTLQSHHGANYSSAFGVHIDPHSQAPGASREGMRTISNLFLTQKEISINC